MVRTRVAQLALEGWTVVAFGVAVALLALGSSVFADAKSVAGKGKWVAMAGFCLLAVMLALRARPRRGITPLHWAVTLLAGLMVVSAAWSVAPKTTAKYTAATILMLVAAGAIGYAVAARPELARRLGYALAVVAVAVAAAGLLLILVSRTDALNLGSSSQPTRLRGIEENPNTAPLLLVPALPFVALYAFEARTRVARGLAVTALAILYVTLFASASRGAWAAGIAVSLALAALVPNGARRKAAAAIAAIALWGVGIGVQHATIARAAGSAPVAHVHAASGARSWLSGYPVRGGYLSALDEELAPHVSSAWSIFGSSGRTGAWSGAIKQALGRPLLGFGFGTEQLVFVDRYYNFQGSRVESSYVGLFLQLGVAGLGALAAVLVILVAAAVRGFRLFDGRDRRTVAAFAAAALGGLLLAVGQSYLYSAGNIAALSFWVVAFALAGVGLGRAHA